MASLPGNEPAASGPFWAVGIFQVLCAILPSASRSTTITAKTYWALVIRQVLFWYVLSLFFSQLPWKVGSIIISVSYKCRKWDTGSLKKEASQGPTAERIAELGFKPTVWSQRLYTCHGGIPTCLLHSICVSGFSHDIWGWSPSPLLWNPTKTQVAFDGGHLIPVGQCLHLSCLDPGGDCCFMLLNKNPKT